jgi:(p)ppGpp synthase/HD superfamily hydrolase
MNNPPLLKDDYRLANCCNPGPDDKIIGFLKFDTSLISVHKQTCSNLAKVDRDRLVTLTWAEIIKQDSERDLSSDPNYKALDDIDFKILKHHQVMGNDYAATVANMTQIPLATVFARHKKLRDLKLLKRVQPVMMQYRKGIVKNKWIKHRNHTYYEITAEGLECLKWYQQTNDKLS